MTIKVQWIDSEREPQRAADPKYPDGVDIDLAPGKGSGCKVMLLYPAPRCGMFVLECDECGADALITTAGRRDDPRSVRLACKAREKMQ